MMMFLIPADKDGERLDRALAELAQAGSRSWAQTQIRAGRVRIDGRTVSKPRTDKGRATAKKAASGDAPKLAAASMGPRPIAMNALASGCTMKGRE